VSPEKTIDLTSVEAWIRQDALWAGDPVDIVDGLAARIVESGIPIFRLTTGIPILHPNVFSVSILWEQGRKTVVRRYSGENFSESVFHNSPLYAVYRSGTTERVAVTPEPAEGEYGIVEDLRAMGATDYLAVPMRFSDRSYKALTFAARAPGGFTGAQVAALESIAAQMAPIFEIHMQTRKAATLLNTYVGKTAGRRVLDGEIRRGDGEAIRAVIWFSDLRDFTALGNALDGPELIALLNRYFGAVTRAVEEGGGEVLKFIGDAVLAIFPYEDEAGAPEMAAAALAAAGRALEALRQDAEAGPGDLRCGIALHAGEVFYGNVGGEARLDFTVIGPAVNLTSRIEGMTRELGRPLLVSETFAALLETRPHSLGRHRLKGVADPVEIFAPD